jgi:hypothetical protein
MHPLLSEEIESVLRDHIGLRITLFAITPGIAGRECMAYLSGLATLSVSDSW